MQQHEDIWDLASTGPVVVIEGWERHAQSEAGVGADVLKTAMEALEKFNPNLGTVFLKVEPVQFYPLAGGEPSDIQAARRTAVRRIVGHALEEVPLSPSSKARLRFVDPLLSGDVKDVLRDRDISGQPWDVLQGVMLTRLVWGHA